jgi:SAM-dependent methyltransferase
MTRLLSNGQCPACGAGDKRRQVASLTKFRVLRCGNCHTDSVAPLPDNEALARVYDNFDAGVVARESFEEYTDNACTILKSDLQEAGIDNRAQGTKRFLDYGCGGGHFVRAAGELGFSAFGIDVDDESSKFGAQHGLAIAAGSAADVERNFGPGRFQVILVMHVLEHTLDPHQLLIDLLTKLEPGGCLIIGVPDQDSFPSRLKILMRSFGIKRSELGFVQPPIHLHGFRISSFPVIAAGVGLKVIRSKKTSPVDNASFPTSKLYWKGLAVQRTVYQIGRLLGSGGHLKVTLQRPVSA